MLWAFAVTASAQTRPYVGFAYPAGGQQGTTFQIKLGGQGLEDVEEVFITGSGVSAKVVQYNRALNPQEVTLLNEQVRELKKERKEAASAMMSGGPLTATSDAVMTGGGTNADRSVMAPVESGDETRDLIARIEKRVAEYVNRPASVALANIVYAEVTIAAEAPPGQRELRLGTPRGVSNPIVFDVGQLPEASRKPMVTALYQVLGKEEQALRKRPANEAEDRITIPCTVNGQIASGEINRHRFAARKGQRLVISTRARQLIPYIADAVPGWFQPVLSLSDSDGKEVAYDDDYRFKPDPTILYEVPKDGDYVLSICDAIYRGREDFVYRITIGEFPFLTSMFPLGDSITAPAAVKVKGWNLTGATLTSPSKDAGTGLYSVVATREGFVSNPLPFARDSLPEAFEKEPNDAPAQAQKVTLPVMLNGRMNRPGDWDVFCFTGKSNDVVVAEVLARRLDSPMDSVVKLTDAGGALLAFNDDCEDLAAGVNTHDADSYLQATLPADGTYYVHLGDTARKAGEEYGYRLRIGPPRPDFALRIVPSSISLRVKSTATLTVHAIRKDGFAGAIKVTLKDPPAGFSATPVSITGTQAVVRLIVKTDLTTNCEPASLSIEGSAKIGGKDVAHVAVPAEDRMQAFLWRHLVPATELKVAVFDPSSQRPPRRTPRPHPPVVADTKPAVVSTNAAAGNKPKFTKQQVAGRLRQLKLLFEEGLLTDDFYDEKVVECEAAGG
ncbi:MAG TPA: hypothetical protein VJA21_33285 [Verrucomicrobiae bacterium]